MRPIFAFLALTATCGPSPAAEERPHFDAPAPEEGRAEARQDVKEDVSATVKSLLEPLLGKNPYKISYKSTHKLGDGDTFTEKGDLYRKAEGLIFVKVDSQEKKIEGVRVGAKVWQWNEDAGAWGDSADGADDTLAKGLRDPDVVLGLLKSQADKAARKDKAIEIALAGDDLKKILTQFADNNIDWPTAKATVTLEGDKKLRSLKISASLKTRNNQKVTYSGAFEIGEGEITLSQKLPPEAEKAIQEHVK